MNGVRQTSPHEYFRTPAKVAAGTSFVEGMVALSAVALSIIGLANVYPMILVSVATIALGAALLFEAGAIAARFSAVRTLTTPNISIFGYWSGIGISFVAGVGGIAMGILSVLGIKPMVLVPIAAIAFGCTLILDSWVNARISAEVIRGEDQEVVRETGTASYGLQVFAGLAAIALGILALVTAVPLLLSLVAMLSIGAAFLLSGTVIGGKMLQLFSEK
jgi:hypothetical protein